MVLAQDKDMVRPKYRIYCQNDISHRDLPCRCSFFHFYYSNDDVDDHIGSKWGDECCKDAVNDQRNNKGDERQGYCPNDTHRRFCDFTGHSQESLYDLFDELLLLFFRDDGGDFELILRLLLHILYAVQNRIINQQALSILPSIRVLTRTQKRQFSIFFIYANRIKNCICLLIQLAIYNPNRQRFAMKTRAQRKKEEQEGQPSSPKVAKKTKKQLLEEKNKKKSQAAPTDDGGKKKIKEDPLPLPPTRHTRKGPVRVEEKRSSPKAAKSVKKTLPDAKQDAKNTSESKEKKEENESRPRKKPEQQVKPAAKDAGQSKSKLSAKDNSKDEKESAKEQIKTIQFKGKVPLDEHCGLSNTGHHVVQHNGKVYSATLNQTKVQSNNNKFYILQIIQSDSNKQYQFYTRWGRVGVRGQTSLVRCSSIDEAIRLYNSKYYQKASKGDYEEIELCYDVEEPKKPDQPENSDQTNKNKQSQFDQSKLPSPVKKLIQLIFDLKMMNNHMMQIGFNVKKMPLGNLKKQHIQRGYAVLNDLMAEIRGKNSSERISELSSKFYTLIPHDFGFNHMSRFILKDEKMVKEKIVMLEALTEIKVATSILQQDKEAQNRLDSNYKKLNRDVNPIDKESSEFELINRYLQSTHASTHTSYTLELVDLFSLRSQAEEIRFTKHIPNKMLLWHGSRLTNFVGILSQGLRIAPPQAPVTGYMFGKGVYFADMSSKSANYCFTSRESSTGILLLCEVALGEVNEKMHADYYAGNLPPGKSSTKGMGRTAPNPDNAVKMDDGVVIPMGPGEPAALACTLLYNEFIVYDIAQIKIRYLLRTKFNYRH